MLSNFAKVFKRGIIKCKRLKASKWPIYSLNVESSRSCNLQCLQWPNHAKKVSIGHFTKTHTNIDSRFLRRIIIRNHIYLFRKNIPKNLSHLCGFFMSILGLLLYNSIVARDICACLGLIEGIIHPVSVAD